VHFAHSRYIMTSLARRVTPTSDIQTATTNHLHQRAHTYAPTRIARDRWIITWTIKLIHRYIATLTVHVHKDTGFESRPLTDKVRKPSRDRLLPVLSARTTRAHQHVDSFLHRLRGISNHLSLLASRTRPPHFCDPLWALCAHELSTARRRIDLSTSGNIASGAAFQQTLHCELLTQPYPPERLRQS